jgi:hypothetical protein
VAEGTVGAKLEFAELGGLGIVGKWILVVCQDHWQGPERGQEREQETAANQPLKPSAGSPNYVQCVQGEH